MMQRNRFANSNRRPTLVTTITTLKMLGDEKQEYNIYIYILRRCLSPTCRREGPGTGFSCEVRTHNRSAGQQDKKQYDIIIVLTARANIQDNTAVNSYFYLLLRIISYDRARRNDFGRWK